MKEVQWFKVGILVMADAVLILMTHRAGITLIMILCILNCGNSKPEHPNNCIITPQRYATTLFFLLEEKQVHACSPDHLD